MKCLLLILANFNLISSLYAKEIVLSSVQENIKTISDINKGKLLKAKDAVCIPMIESTASLEKPFALFNQCAVDMCGEAAKNKSAWISDENFPDTLNWIDMRKVEKQTPLINQVYDIKVKNKLKELGTLKNFIKDSNNIKNSTLSAQSYLAKLSLLKYLKVTVKTPDTGEPITKRIQVKVNPPANASAELVASLNNYAENLTRAAVENPYGVSSPKLFTTEELKEITQSMFTKIEKSVKEHPNALRPDYANALYFVGRTYDKVQDRSIYENNLLLLNQFNEDIQKATKIDTLGSAICNIPACDAVYKNYLNNKDFSDSMASYEKLLTDPIAKKNAALRCKASIILGESKTADNNKAQEIFSKSRDSIIQNVLPLFSEHSRQVMKDYLNKQLDVSAKLPLNNLGMKVPAAQIFNAKANKFITENKLQPDKVLNDVAIIGNIDRIATDYEQMDPLADKDNLCSNGNMEHNLWDAFIPIATLYDVANDEDKKTLSKIGDNNHIFVSDFSCQHADYGHHLIAHEIGHALNFLFKTTQLSQSSAEFYKKARNCVAANNQEATQILASQMLYKHDGDTTYTEEDMADLFAAVATRDDKKIYSCSFLQKSITSESYANLDFLATQDDLHSSGLNRVIQEAKNKDVPLSASCQQLLVREKPKTRFNKCL